MEQKLNLIKKIIENNHDGFIQCETRWFVETNDGFDGTAQGYGYKSPQSLYKAYHYFKNKNKYKKNNQEIKTFLKNNPDIKNEFEKYFDAQESLWRLKDGDEDSLEDMIEGLDDQELIEKFQSQSTIIKKIFDYYMKN